MRLRRFASIIALTPASKALSHLTSVHPLVIKIGKLLPVCSKMCIFVVEMAGKALFPVCLRMSYNSGTSHLFYIDCQAVIRKFTLVGKSFALVFSEMPLTNTRFLYSSTVRTPTITLLY